MATLSYCRVDAGAGLAATLMLAAASGVAAPTDLDATFGGNGVSMLAIGQTIGNGRLAPDGGVVLSVAGIAWVDGFPREVITLRRLQAEGRIDPDFGIDGTATTGCEPDCLLGSFDVASNGLIVARYQAEESGPPFRTCGNRITRFLPDGAKDRAFGTGGDVNLGVDACSYSRSMHSLASDRAGQAYVVQLAGTFHFAAGSASNWIAHVDASGARLPNIGTMAASPPVLPRTYSHVARGTDDRIVVTAPDAARRFAVMRFSAGQADSTFGDGGLAVAEGLEGVAMGPPIVAPDGSVLIPGVDDAPGSTRVTVARFTPDGRADPAFGSGGIAATEHRDRSVEALLALQPDGRIVVAATVGDGYSSRIAVARLLPNGTPDLHFAAGGMTELHALGGSVVRFVAIRPDGRIVVGANSVQSRTSTSVTWTPTVFQLEGGNLPVAKPLPERRAVEYFHTGYGHYFMSADAMEIASLYANSPDWQPTGRSFAVFDSAGDGLVPVCRFWSNQWFAPKSSHFYTPYAEECASVKSQPAWLFERNAFYVRMPIGAIGSRNCPAGTQPLYRMYNANQGGAPNHRYTTDAALLDAMIAQGWIMEGEAHTRVFACVPLQ